MVAILQPLKNHKPIPIDRAVILVGRGEDCDVVINGSKKISRKHCCLVHSDQSFLIRDLGSTNGVWVNGKRIDRESEMRDGDRVAIGDVKFQFFPNGARQVAQQASGSNLAGSGVEVLPAEEPAEEAVVQEAAEIVDDDLLDDGLLDDGLLENEDIDLIDEDEVQTAGRAPSSPPPPPPPPPAAQPFRGEIESEPVINLDDDYDDDAIDDADIITFDDD